MNNLPTRARLPVLALALATALPALCNVQGKLQVNASKVEYTGTIRWKNTEKKYEITTEDRRTFSFNPDAVSLLVARPPQLEKAIKDLAEGKNAAVVAGLNPVLDNFIMFPNDEEIASVLAQALLAQNNAAEAIKVCEKLTIARPETAYRGKMVAAYWAALLKANRGSKLESLLEQAVKTGDIPAMAQACVLRGDMILNTSNPTREDYRNALVDGYLRVIFLYPREARNVLPEALYKAAECFGKIGQSSRAQEYRAQLQKEFPNSSWALK